MEEPLKYQIIPFIEYLLEDFGSDLKSEVNKLCQEGKCQCSTLNKEG